MRLMCWDMDIEHRNDAFLADADYWSHLGADLCFDPLLKSYIEQVNSLRARNPSPAALPPLPANMPYLRGPRLPRAITDEAISPGANDTVANPVMPPLAPPPGKADSVPAVGFQHCANYAVHFGRCIVNVNQNHATSCPADLYNWHSITAAASILSKFD